MKYTAFLLFVIFKGKLRLPRDAFGGLTAQFSGRKYLNSRAKAQQTYQQLGLVGLVIVQSYDTTAVFKIAIGSLFVARKRHKKPLHCIALGRYVYRHAVSWLGERRVYIAGEKSPRPLYRVYPANIYHAAARYPAVSVLSGEHAEFIVFL